MASRLPQVITEEFLTCKICLDSFREPKSLACLHTFCMQCLENYLSANLLGNQLPCPACRQVTIIPDGRISALRDNFFIAGLQDVIELDPTERGTTQCDSCASHGDRKEASMRCLNCREFLCDECNRAHQRLTLTKNHITIAYQTAHIKPVSAARQIKAKSCRSGKANTKAKSCEVDMMNVPCAAHVTEESKLYCEQCLVPLCVTCKLTDHDNHRCCSLAAGAEKERQQLIQICTNLRQKSENCNGLLQDWQQYANELAQHGNTAVTQLESRKHELHTLIEHWHQINLEDLHRQIQQENQKIERRIVTLTEQKNTSIHVADELQSLVPSLTGEALFGLGTRMRCQTDGLNSQPLLDLALTQKFQPQCSFPSLNDTAYLGTIDMLTSVATPNMAYLQQNLHMIKTFETRPAANYKLRYDASSIAVCPDGSLIITDRQLDCVCIYNQFGRCTLKINMSLMGKALCAIQLDNRDIVIVREKSSLCVFSGNGKDKRVIKENLSKPCHISVGKKNTFLLLDYDLKSVFVFCSQTYQKLGQIHLPYKTSSKWDKLVLNQNGHLYLCAHKENCIYEFTRKGRCIAQYGQGGSHEPGQLYWPRGLVIMPDGSLLVVDSGNECLQLLVHQRLWLRMQVDGDGLRCPTDVALIPDASIAVLLNTGTVLILRNAP